MGFLGANFPKAYLTIVNTYNGQLTTEQLRCSTLQPLDPEELS